MNTEYVKTIRLLKEGKLVKTISINLEKDGLECSLTTDCELVYEKRYISSDYFRALGRMRDDLNKVGYTPAVYGAHIDVFPGGLAGDSSDGLFAFHFFSSQEKTLVDIFAEVPASEYKNLATYEEQKAKRRLTIRSGKNRNNR